MTAHPAYSTSGLSKWQVSKVEYDSHYYHLFRRRPCRGRGHTPIVANR